MRSLLLAVLVASAGCVVVPPRAYVRVPGPQPGPPPYEAGPAPRQLSENEAVSIAGQYAESHGLRVDRVRHAHLDASGRWHVELRGPGRDRAKVIVDAFTGQVVRAKLKGSRRGHDEDDDEDDDD